MLPILLSLTALAADIVIDNKPFTAISGVARANPDQPGALQIALIEGDVTCASLQGQKLDAKVRFVDLGFSDAVATAEITTAMPVLKGKFQQGTWTGTAKLTEVPSARGGTGTVELAFTGKNKASGTATFTLCTDPAPYVSPATDWISRTWTVSHDVNIEDSTQFTLPVTMLVPDAWKRQDNIKVAHGWIAADHQTHMSLMIGRASDDVKASFDGYADSTLSLFGAETTVLERSFEDGVGVLVTERASSGTRHGYDISALVQRPGWTQSVQCSGYTDSRAHPDTWKQIAQACRSMQSP